MQISEVLGILATSSRVLQQTSNLEPYSRDVIIIIFMLTSTIPLTIFCTSWFRHCNFNTHPSRYLNPHDYFQAIHCQLDLMQHYAFARNVQVQHLLQQVQYASDQSVWHFRWTHQHNQYNQANHCTLLESPPHILELEDVISIVGSSCTSQRRWILIFRWADASEIGGCALVECSKSIIQEKEELGLGRCYRGHCPYIGPRWNEIQIWSLGWHPYILPCNQVPDTQQM